MFHLTEETIDPALARECLADPSCGAVVEFTGVVRNHHLGNRVHHIEFTAHPVLAREAGLRLCQEAVARFGLSRALIIHRLGAVAVGEAAVWVGVASPHRQAAFEAAAYLMDQLKSHVPIWKKEFREDGSSFWQEGTPLPGAAVAP